MTTKHMVLNRKKGEHLEKENDGNKNNDNNKNEKV